MDCGRISVFWFGWEHLSKWSDVGQLIDIDNLCSVSSAISSWWVIVVRGLVVVVVCWLGLDDRSIFVGPVSIIASRILEGLWVY